MKYCSAIILLLLLIACGNKGNKYYLTFTDKWGTTTSINKKDKIVFYSENDKSAYDYAIGYFYDNLHSFKTEPQSFLLTDKQGNRIFRGNDSIAYEKILFNMPKSEVEKYYNKNSDSVCFGSYKYKVYPDFTEKDSLLFYLGLDSKRFEIDTYNGELPKAVKETFSHLFVSYGLPTSQFSWPSKKKMKDEGFAHLYAWVMPKKIVQIDLYFFDEVAYLGIEPYFQISVQIAYKPTWDALYAN